MAGVDGQGGQVIMVKMGVIVLDVNMKYQRMSMRFFLSQTTSFPRLKYSILYSFISELYNSENGISKIP